MKSFYERCLFIKDHFPSEKQWGEKEHQFVSLIRQDVKLNDNKLMYFMYEISDKYFPETYSFGYAAFEALLSYRQGLKLINLMCKYSKNIFLL